MGNEGRLARLMGRKNKAQEPVSRRKMESRFEERKRTVRFNYQLHDEAATRLEDMGLPTQVIDDINTVMRTGMAIKKDLADIVWETALRKQGLNTTTIVEIVERKNEIETEIILDIESEE